MFSISLSLLPAPVNPVIRLISAYLRNKTNLYKMHI